jgi:hypothetical protein
MELFTSDTRRSVVGIKHLGSTIFRLTQSHGPSRFHEYIEQLVRVVYGGNYE